MARRWGPPLLLLAGLAVALALGLHRQLTLDALAVHRESLTRFVAEDGALAALAYVGLYALVVAFSVPGAMVLTLAGGFLFGTVAGTAYAVAGATAGAVAVFLAARSAFGGLLRAKAGPWVGRLERGFRENAFSYTLFLRLVPLFPFWLVNLVPAVLGVPLGVYALATLVGIVPGALVYASVGNGLGAVLDAGGRPDLGLVFAPKVLLPLVGLGLLALLPVALKRWRR
ncbi:TVP38/TMEM64 family protein [Azospirillum sp. sgz302134]